MQQKVFGISRPERNAPHLNPNYFQPPSQVQYSLAGLFSALKTYDNY